ncbi:MAG: PEP/pyruvate-binding domain-containing protein, partial [Acidimicrobiales bacterium]
MLGPDDCVLGQREVLEAPVRCVGAKAATLARLADEGVPVPAFYVVTADAFASHLARNKIVWPAPGDEADREKWAKMRESIAASPIEEALSRQILGAHARMCSQSGHEMVAVRSSGSEEDSKSASFAGQFSSFLNLQGTEIILDAVKDCWASYLSERSRQYRAANCIPLGPVPSFGVIVQTQVLSERAGVIFTMHPLDLAGGSLYIEANFGTGESIVGGLVTPDSATVSRLGVVETFTATKRRMTQLSLESHGTEVVEVQGPRRDAPVLSEVEVRELSR